MSKEAIIIQSFNDVKQQYEYSVKGYDVTESVKILLKRHKEEYDQEKNVFAGIQGFIEAQQLYENDLADLEAKLAESKKQCQECKHLNKKIELNIKNKLMNETQQLKQQLHDLPKKIVEEVKDDLLDFSNGWWRYFMTDGCEYMLSSDLQGCLDEIIDTILKKYGGEDESNND